MAAEGSHLLNNGDVLLGLVGSSWQFGSSRWPHQTIGISGILTESIICRALPTSYPIERREGPCFPMEAAARSRFSDPFAPRRPSVANALPKEKGALARMQLRGDFFDGIASQAYFSTNGSRITRPPIEKSCAIHVSPSANGIEYDDRAGVWFGVILATSLLSDAASVDLRHRNLAIMLEAWCHRYGPIPSIAAVNAELSSN